MAEDQPGPPGSSNHDDQPGQRPTEPLGGPAQPEPPPAFAVAGPPREALAGFWLRLVAAFLDWLLVGILAAAIGDLFGVEAPAPPLWEPRKRTWHDMVADSLVVRTTFYPPGEFARPAR